ncbi:hypothetical protein CWE04_02810 [Thomasclavelia cocleata]|nr:hypothetical protein [Thomasclavelia cocleata]PJN81370.1 hypothetical protein CWE04_02810 [Thomasclavelia cocleata]
MPYFWHMLSSSSIVPLPILWNFNISSLGWYRRSGMDIINFILSPKVLGNKKGDRPGLVNPLDYYLKSL